MKRDRFEGGEDWFSDRHGFCADGTVENGAKRGFRTHRCSFDIRTGCPKRGSQQFRKRRMITDRTRQDLKKGLSWEDDSAEAEKGARSDARILPAQDGVVAESSQWRRGH